MATFASFIHSSHRPPSEPLHISTLPSSSAGEDGAFLNVDGLPSALSSAHSTPPIHPDMSSAPGYLDIPLNHGAPPPLTPRSAGPDSVPTHSSLEILLPSTTIIMRGQGGEYEPQLLMGDVVLNLAEATNIRELTAQLTGKAKIHYHDSATTSSRHHSDSVTLIEHEWSFLQGERKHMHTLKAGRHAFPFQLELPGNLQASLRTLGGNATISYKMRANAIRSAFATNFSDSKTINIVRSFTLDALEYTQTLELENTWPGKIMYSIMIPHRAHPAGTAVPVSVKFTPLSKGVEVKSILSEIKEYITLTTKAGPVSSTRTVCTARHIFQNGRAFEAPTPRTALLRAQTQSSGALPTLATTSTGGAPLGPRTSRSTPSLHALAAQSRGLTIAHSDGSDPSLGGGPDGFSHSPTALTPSPSQSAPRTPPNGHEEGLLPGYSQGMSYSLPQEESFDLGSGTNEIDTTFKFPIAIWASPSHSLKPVQISHKIKWCCMLSNLDGHTSELRCALPIHILSPVCAEEARLATSNAYNLLYGADGQPDEPVIELPSYPEHVRDRVANASLDGTTIVPVNPSAAFSAFTSPSTSPRTGFLTPPSDFPEREPMLRFAEPEPLSTVSSAEESYFTPTVPTNGFVNAELLSSLGSAFGSPYAGASASSSSYDGSHLPTPVDSRASSRPNSRPTSRVQSRASSPEPREREPGPFDSTTTLGSDSTSRPPPSGGGLFHMTGIKPLTTFSAKGKGKATTPPDGATPTAAGPSRRLWGTRSRPSSPTRTPISLPLPDPLTQVPDYEIASRGFLGGGVVPLTASQGLPSYDEAAREHLEGSRSRSETSLTDLARRVEQASLAHDAENFHLHHAPSAAAAAHSHHHTPHTHGLGSGGLQMTSLRRS